MEDILNASTHTKAERRLRIVRATEKGNQWELGSDGEEYETGNDGKVDKNGDANEAEKDEVRGTVHVFFS